MSYIEKLKEHHLRCVEIFESGEVISCDDAAIQTDDVEWLLKERNELLEELQEWRQSDEK